MRDIAEKTKSNLAERIAVMAALNIAHEHLGRIRNRRSSIRKLNLK
jgi:cell division protein ZapA